MGKVYTRLTLENIGDRVLAKFGHVSEASVRRLELDARVDTLAVLTMLPQDAVESLGLLVTGELLTRDGKTWPVARGLSLTVCGRDWDTDCIVGPEAVIGKLVLTRLDLIVDRDVLRPRADLPTVKMKEEARQKDLETLNKGIFEEMERTAKRTQEMVQQAIDQSTRREREWLEQRIEKLEEAVERLENRSRP
jgi:hypothetical protein